VRASCSGFAAVTDALTGVTGTCEEEFCVHPAQKIAAQINRVTKSMRDMCIVMNHPNRNKKYRTVIFKQDAGFF
jgi:hypothetical protein